MTYRHLFLALALPDEAFPLDDPDDVADAIVRELNHQAAKAEMIKAIFEHREHVPPERIRVSGIPAPQWLTPDTLANLRRAASDEPTP